MMEAEKMEEAPPAADEVSIARNLEETLTPCCCCLCSCSNEYTKDSKCCGCFPIKCGVLTIGIFTVLLTIYMVTMNFFLILNDYIHWYFPVIILILLVPMCIGSSFFVVFFTKDTASSRGKLFTACMFGIISTALIDLPASASRLSNSSFKIPPISAGLHRPSTIGRSELQRNSTNNLRNFIKAKRPHTRNTIKSKEANPLRHWILNRLKYIFMKITSQISSIILGYWANINQRAPICSRQRLM